MPDRLQFTNPSTLTSAQQPVVRGDAQGASSTPALAVGKNMHELLALRCGMSNLSASPCSLQVRASVEVTNLPYAQISSGASIAQAVQLSSGGACTRQRRSDIRALDL